MIISNLINIKVHTKNIKKIKENGYDVSINDNILLPIEYLDKNSHQIIKVKCDICGKEKDTQYRYYNDSISKYNYYACSSKCAINKNKLTNLKKYGVENVSQCDLIKNKKINTNLKNWGVDNIFKCDEIKNNIKESLLKKYNVKNVSQIQEVKEKIKNKNLNKYGNCIFFKSDYFKRNRTYYRKSDEYKNKIIDDYFKKYNIDIINIKTIDNNTYYNIKCDNNHEHVFSINSDMLRKRINYNTVLCTICNKKYDFTKSGIEIQLLNFINENYNGEIISNYRLNNNEIDIYIKDLKIGFELNGVWWHNELFKNKNYHKNKKLFFKEKGIDIFFIYEDDWIYKQHIIKSMILNKLNKTSDRISARKCKIVEVKKHKLIKEFLNKNHIQGYTKCSINLALYYNNEIVSMMSFNKRRLGIGKNINNDNDYELVRFCNKINIIVNGGASKLFNYFKLNFPFNNIISFANLDYSNGHLYKKIGFKLQKVLNPNYYYVVNGIRKHRFGFRKDVLVKQGYDPNKTEHEIMLEKNIYRIYNSGNLKYKLDKNG